MKYQITNVPHVVLVERTWKDKKVVHSLRSNVPELIGHAVCVLLDNSYKIFLCLNCMWSWPSDSGVPVHSVDPTGKSCSLVLMVCGSRYAMNCVPSILTNLAATSSYKLLPSLW